MRKFLIIAASLLIILLIVDRTILKDKGLLSQVQIDQYEEIENPENVAVGLEIGQKAPEIQLETLDGESFQLSDYEGKKILLNFWASWCGPCEEEMPYMEKVYKEYKDDGFEVIAVNMTKTERNETNAANFVKANELSFIIPMDPEGVVLDNYEVIAYPTSYFIDSDGIIRNKVLGALNEDFLEKEILRLP
ncbi:TlpA disulfide reductase family protein [Cytobacillus kochii]